MKAATAMTTSDMEPAPAADATWTEICALDDLVPGTGACALVDGRQVAIVRPDESDRLYALDNLDPFSGAMVISRGIVGDAKGVPKIASPVYKQSFDLRTGRCLDDPSVAIPVYACRVEGGRVWLSV